MHEHSGNGDYEESFESERTAVVVLGMHGPGTSVVANTLGELGAQLPKSASCNPEDTAGYAGTEMVDMNDHLLRSAGTWWGGWQSIGTMANDLGGVDVVEQVADIIVREHGDANVIALCDPRISRLHSVWITALEALHYRPVFLVTVDDPAALFATLSSAHVSAEEAELSTLAHILDADEASHGYQRAFVSPHRLALDRQSELRRIGDALGLGLQTIDGRLCIPPFGGAHVGHGAPPPKSLLPGQPTDSAKSKADPADQVHHPQRQSAEGTTIGGVHQSLHDVTENLFHVLDRWALGCSHPDAVAILKGCREHLALARALPSVAVIDYPPDEANDGATQRFLERTAQARHQEAVNAWRIIASQRDGAAAITHAERDTSLRERESARRAISNITSEARDRISELTQEVARLGLEARDLRRTQKRLTKQVAKLEERGRRQTRRIDSHLQPRASMGDRAIEVLIDSVEQDAANPRWLVRPWMKVRRAASRLADSDLFDADAYAAAHPDAPREKSAAAEHALRAGIARQFLIGHLKEPPPTGDGEN